MEIKIKKQLEVLRENLSPPSIKLYNPNALDHNLEHRMKSIEFSNEYTIIDFMYRSSDLYENGGWIQMDKNAYISPVGSIMKYKLIHAIGIPIAPLKHCLNERENFTVIHSFFPPYLQELLKLI